MPGLLGSFFDIFTWFGNWPLVLLPVGAVVGVITAVVTHSRTAAQYPDARERFRHSLKAGLLGFVMVYVVAVVAIATLAGLILLGAWVFSELFP